MPWELQARLADSEPPLLVDVREPAEFARVRLAGSLNVPRGVLEQACEWEFEETEPLLAATRTRALVLVCRSGNRSLLAAEQLVRMGFTQVRSLRTGLRGWVDAELPLVAGDAGLALDIDEADARLQARLRPEQRAPRRPA